MAAKMNESPVAYKMLLKPCEQSCDFCEKTFRNQFESIIHNASHIIIPLIKQKCYQCIQCLDYFASQHDLQNHIESLHSRRSKHDPITTNKRLNSRIHYKNDSMIPACSNIKIEKPEVEISTNSVSPTSIRKEIKTEVASPINKCSLKLKIEDKDYEQCDYNTQFNDNKTNSIKSRLKFEDEELPDCDILNDLISGCKVEVYNTPIKKMMAISQMKVDDNIKTKHVDNPIINVEQCDDNPVINVNNLYRNSERCNTSISVPIKNMMAVSPIGDHDSIKTKHVDKPTIKLEDLCRNKEQRDVKSGIAVDNLYGNRERCNYKSISDVAVFNNVDAGRDDVKANRLNFEDSDKDSYEYDNFAIPNVQTPVRPQIQIKPIKIVPVRNYIAVHYDKLMKPGIFNCKYCSKSFPNRLTLIKHEPDHMKVKRCRPPLCTYCDKYIAGNYRNLHNHITRVHPEARVDKKHQTHKCKRCGLRFRKYLWHIKNYHPLDCSLCGKEFGKNEDSEREEHSLVCSMKDNVMSKVINVCELCCCFFKVSSNLKYILMGTINELGVRYPCAMCGKKFFELKTVRRICKMNYHHEKERKPISNEDRLKNVMKRMKKINFLNKFYSCGFIFSFCPS